MKRASSSQWDAGRTLRQKLTDAMSVIYAELHREIERTGLDCEVCGKCCHFDTIGHTLFASTPEIAYLLVHAEAPPGPTENVCPFLCDGKCAVREHRLLGCRVFFCSAAGSDSLQDLYNRYHRRLAALSDELGLEWRYLPFLQHLRAGGVPGEVTVPVEVGP